MFKPSKRVAAHVVLLIIVANAFYIIGVNSNGSNPTVDELLGIFDFTWLNTTQGVDSPQYYRNGQNYTAWIESITGSATDHGTLTGLDDDDHSLYLLQDGTEGLTGDWDVGEYDLTAKDITADEFYRTGLGNYTAWIESISVGGSLGGPLADYPWDFYLFRNGSGMHAIDHTGSVVKSDTNNSEVIQYAVDNLNSRGGKILFGNMAADINYPIILEDKTGVQLIGASPSTQTSSSYMGATQLNSLISGDAVFKLIGCEGVSIINFYLYTGRTDNWGILIDGTSIYPEHILIQGVQIRKFLRGIYFKNVWASNVGGVVRDCHISTTTGGYCIYAEDLNGWTLASTVISGNARKGNGILFTDGDQGRTPRVDMYQLQFIGVNESFIHINTASRAVGINIYGGNMENLEATTGIAFIYVENCDGFATIASYGTTFQTANGHDLFRSDETIGNVHMAFYEPYCQGPYTVDMTNSPDVRVYGGHNFNVSNLNGETIVASNPSGKSFISGTKYFNPFGMLSPSTVESRAQWTVPKDGYIKNFRVLATSPATAGNVTVRVDGVSTSGFITLTGGGGEDWYSDTSHHIAVEDGDLVSLMIVATDDTTLYNFELEYITP